MFSRFIITITIVLFSFVYSSTAQILFFDDFNVTNGGGDINYQYEVRQSGAWAPIQWWSLNQRTYVTNAGDRAGLLYVDTMEQAQYFAPTTNFSVNNCLIEYKICRKLLGRYLRFCFDFIPQATSDSDIAGFMQFNGDSIVNVFRKKNNTNAWESSGLQGSTSNGELAFYTNNVVRVVLSGVKSDEPKTALFIDGKAYMTGIITNSAGLKYYKFIFTHQGEYRPFINGSNYFTFFHASPRPAQTNYAQADIDYVKVETVDDVAGFEMEQWTGTNDFLYDDTGSVSTNDIIAVNLLGDEVVINGITFADGHENPGGYGYYGDNWQMYIASSGDFQTHDSEKFSGDDATTNLMKGFIYKDRNAIALTISDLTPGQRYRIIYYGTAWEDGSRKADIAASDGAIITNLNLDAYGVGPGVRLSHEYIAPDNGVFTLAMNGWHWYAFMNYPIPEPTMIIFLILLCFFRKIK